MRFGSFARTDPGPCPICEAAHCSCGGGQPIAIVQLPNRDAAVARGRDDDAPVVAPGLGDGADGRPFSTATYRGTTKKA